MGSRDWSNLNVSEATKSFIKEQRFARMTPVQAIAIPLLLNRRDVAVEACTGSGKTLAFLIPVVEILMQCEDVGAAAFNVGCAILAPTRELAGQIHEVLGSFIAAVIRVNPAAGARLGTQLLVGGTDAKSAVEAFRQIDARGKLQTLVATPGRLCAIMELAGKAVLNFKAVEVLVLDEADRLLQLGFDGDINRILAAVPKQRRTGLFSATLTSELQRLMKTGMRNPVHVCVRLKRPVEGTTAEKDSQQPKPKRPVEGTTADKDSQEPKPTSEAAAQSEKGATRFELPTTLQNFFITLRAPERLAFLKDFLQAPEVRRGKTLIFLSTCASVDLFHGLLRRILDKPSNPGKKKDKRLQKDSSENRCPIEKLHGQMDQIARGKAYDQFCRAGPGEGIVLLATDLAARGVDVDDVSWVVQFDAPVDPTTFVHRIGRAARAGKSGKSLAMLLPHEDSYVPFLRQRGVAIENLPPSLAPIAWRSGAKVLTTLGAEALEAAIRPAKRLVETDRTVMLRSSKAFVSFVRAYQEHQLPYVFPLKSMDLGSLAVGFCLLRLPRMKEVLGKKIRGFIQSAVLPHDVPFRDKAQERQRQDRLKKITQEEKAANEDYERAEKEKRKEIAQLQQEERTRTEKRKAKRINKEDEWRMLQAEECLAKKARKGKLSVKQFKAKVQKILPGDDSHPEDSCISEDDSDAEEGEGRRAAKRRRLREDAIDALPDHWLKKRKRRRSKGGKAG